MRAFSSISCFLQSTFLSGNSTQTALLKHHNIHLHLAQAYFDISMKKLKEQKIQNKEKNQ